LINSSSGATETWIGISESARHLSVPLRTMYRLAQRGQVPAVKVGRTWRFKKSALDAHLSVRSASQTADDDGRKAVIGSVAGVAEQMTDTARRLSDAHRWSQQLERIDALSRRLNRSRGVAAVADAVASEIATVIDWHGLRFFVVEPDGEMRAIVLRSTVAHYADERPQMLRLRVGQGLAGSVAATGRAEIVPDARADPRGFHIPGTQDVDESVMLVPLVYEDEVLGVLTLTRLGRGAFDATDLRLAQIVAAQAAVALFNARQLEEIQRRGEALERRLASQRQLLAITERLLLTRDRGAIFDAIADTLAEVVPHDTLTIYLVDRSAACLIPILARDPYAEQIMATRPALGAGITGDVINKGEAELINDAEHDPRVINVPGTPSDDEESLIVAPVLGKDGVVGALNLYRVRHEFDNEDLELVKLFANHVAIALENAAMNEQLVNAALTDPLTGLPNRRLFVDRIEHALARRERVAGSVAVFFLDIDRFKLVNDGLGHAAGDAALRAVGERLRSSLRAGDTVARLGGDEFGILIDAVADVDEATRIAQGVFDSLLEPLAIDGHAVNLRASIGLALDRARETLSADELLRDADTAMYRAKSNGRARVAVFEPSMHAHQLARLELDGELRETIARGQLELRYQPIVDLATGQIVAAEALVRWRHPTRGLLSPDDFIKLSEESGHIVALGRWVVREASRSARAWQKQLVVGPQFQVAVNTSAREVVEPGFVDGVLGAVTDGGLSPSNLTLEITESMLLADEVASIAALQRLRDAGVHIVIDDFGTGYSALSYLNQMPVDGLKIDRSFVQGLGRAREKSAIVRATIAFARGLGLVVTAEGIETPAQLRQLVGLHCNRGQGFLFSEPREAGHIAELLRSGGTPYPIPALGSTARVKSRQHRPS
jgi:diguanylate cyclase (GGDEF)-like protein/excisionase family DNA binding protein